MAGRTDIFGQLWKEYSLSDSRYLTQDPFVVCMETVTAFLWGPLSFICAWCIVKDHPLRHPLQIIISLGQLYGDILYYATCSFNEIIYQIVYCRPESIYFWAYYFLCNFFWIVIPGGLILSSIGHISHAFSELKAIKASKKGM
jgi:cholestenol Delta-isomerase